MLLLARYLLDRLLRPAGRASEALDLRRRLRAESSGSRCGATERAAARQARELRVAISCALGAVEACRGCARGKPTSMEGWPGGYCCEAPTTRIFSDDEVAILRAGGTTPGRLPLPLGPAQGCAFRGPRGCSIDPADRPDICGRYLCPTLQRELHARGDLSRVLSLTEALGEAHRRFDRARRSRLDDEAIGLAGMDVPAAPPRPGK